MPMVAKKKTDEYDLYIKDGYPPPQGQTRYDTKLPNGALTHIGSRIKPGQYVENLSPGSMGKLKGLVEESGLIVIQRRRQNEDRGTLYVVTKEWTAADPD